MSETMTHDCGQRWAVVPSILKAHPGYRTEPTTVVVPQEGVYGERLAPRPVQSSRWISEGASAYLDWTQTAVEIRYTWTCLCGEPAVYVMRRSHRVTCLACKGNPSGNAPSPSSTFQVRSACPCCGHGGFHYLYAGTTSPCGASPEDA